MKYLKLKCAKFDFVWGYAPDPAGRANFSVPPESLTGFKGANFEGKAGKDGRQVKGGETEGTYF